MRRPEEGRRTTLLYQVVPGTKGKLYIGAREEPTRGVAGCLARRVDGAEVVVQDKQTLVQRRGMADSLLAGVMQRGEEREGQEEGYKI